MQSSLSPSASDTTTSLLKMLINKIDNTTYPAQEVSLPIWSGPSSTWVQTLAYTSLSSSLLAAFGAVLSKQWLGYFKTSRFGRGALHERCQRRQLNGLEAWHFSTILATVFPFSSSCHYSFRHCSCGKHMDPATYDCRYDYGDDGVRIYFLYLHCGLIIEITGLSVPDTTVLQHVLRDAPVVQMVVRKKWKNRPRSWAGCLDSLREPCRRPLASAKDLILKWIRSFLVNLSRILSQVSKASS
jgi:Family of unknown function (DUF6535)